MSLLSDHHLPTGTTTSSQTKRLLKKSRRCSCGEDRPKHAKWNGHIRRKKVCCSRTRKQIFKHRRVLTFWKLSRVGATQKFCQRRGTGPSSNLFSVYTNIFFFSKDTKLSPVDMLDATFLSESMSKISYKVVVGQRYAQPLKDIRTSRSDGLLCAICCRM